MLESRPLLESLEPRLLMDGGGAGDVPPILDFAGLQWIVRDADAGATGENWYSAAGESVWVDAEGLHLKLRYDEGSWYAAELTTVQPTTYGKHRFYVDGRVDLLDGNVSFGISLIDEADSLSVSFDSDPFTGGANAAYSAGAEIVAPWTIGLNGDLSTHTIEWTPASAAFSSFHWHSIEPETPAHLISEWQYSGDDIPTPADDVHLRLSLQLDDALPPTDGEEVEIVITAIDVPNHAPTVATVAPQANWLTAGETLTATAYEVADSDGAVREVAFYHDVNADGVGATGELLGVDDDGADGWSWTVPATWAPGEHILLAQAVDDDNATGVFVAGSVRIQAAPELTTVIGSGVGAQGPSITFTDPDGSTVVVVMLRGQATLHFLREPITVTDGSGGLVVEDGVRLVEIDFTDTTIRSAMGFRVVGGDGRVEIGRITGSEPMGRVAGTRVDLTGSGVQMTGPGYIARLQLGNLLNGADVHIEGLLPGKGMIMTANEVGPGSVIDIEQGPILGMKFTGLFAGVVTTGVDAGTDGRWFTDDDFAVSGVRTGKIVICRPAASGAGESWGVLTGPMGGAVVVGRTTGLASGEGEFQTRMLPGANLNFGVERLWGPATKRAVIGSATDVAWAYHRVVIYVRDNAGVLQRIRVLKINNKGVWGTRGLPAGTVYAYLVHKDALPPAQILDPLRVEIGNILAEVVLQ